MKEQIVKQGRMTIHSRSFTNISDLLYWTSLDQQNKRAFPKAEPSSQSGSRGFTGTANYNEAEELLKNGWGEGAKKLTAKLKIANMSNHTKDVKRQVYDIVGFQCSVPRYLQGVPQNMINKKNVKQKQKIITLIKSVAYHAGISTEEIMDDSVKFLQMVQEIEKQGIRVNVDVAWSSITGDEQVLYRVNIKKASERLNLSKMSFPLVHPSFLRRICFKVIENEPGLKNTWGFGYGKPAEKREYERILDTKTEYFIPVMISDNDMLDIVNKTKTKKAE